MSKIILYVFEGQKPEQKIFDSLKKYFLDENGHSSLCATFNADIYLLYQKLQCDDFSIDLIEELRPKNQNILAGIERKNIAEIYLFFDYDGHAANKDKTLRADDSHLKEMLSYFNNETENGKLYLSYPMVEAIKHLKNGVNFQDTVVPAKTNIGYKNLVSQNCDHCYNQIEKLTFEHWKTIVEEHCKKLNFIMNESFSFPEKIFEQLDIFNAQLVKYITPKNEVAVLSAFPILLLDYYGVQKLSFTLNKS